MPWSLLCVIVAFIQLCLYCGELCWWSKHSGSQLVQMSHQCLGQGLVSRGFQHFDVLSNEMVEWHFISATVCWTTLCQWKTVSGTLCQATLCWHNIWSTDLSLCKWKQSSALTILLLSTEYLSHFFLMRVRPTLDLFFCVDYNTKRAKRHKKMWSACVRGVVIVVGSKLGAG